MPTPAARPAPRSTRARVPLCDIVLHDAEGTEIRFWCRVEQVAVDKAGGALQERLHHRGEVIGRDADLVYVRFDRGSQSPIPLRPHLLRVLDSPEGSQSTVQ
jgi:hypothetical protein